MTYSKGIGDMNDPSAIIIGIEPEQIKPNLGLKQYVRETTLENGAKYHFWEFEAFYRGSMEEFPNCVVEVLFGKNKPEYFSSVLIHNSVLIDLLGDTSELLEAGKRVLLKRVRDIQARGQLTKTHLDEMVRGSSALKLRVEDRPIEVLGYNEATRIFHFSEETKQEEPLEAISRMYGIDAKMMVKELGKAVHHMGKEGLLDFMIRGSKGELN